MDPVRIALKQTIEGLIPQIPNWLPPAPVEFPGDEDGEGYSMRKETSVTSLRWMLETCLLCLEDWPVDKTSRWIGFVQGVLACKSKDFSVDAERDRTRPFFHAAYAAVGATIPKTTSMQANAAEAKRLYIQHVDNSGIHCNRFPAWEELGAEGQRPWLEKATKA